MIGGRMTIAFTMVITIILAVMPWLIYDLGYTSGQNDVRADWEAQKAADAAANARAAKQAREIEAGLMRHIDEIRRQHEKDIAAIDVRHAAAIERLRKRATRPSDYVPAAPEITGTEPTASCGADRLFREDASALVRLAADADSVRASLTECRASYEAAQQATQGLQTQ